MRQVNNIMTACNSCARAMEKGLAAFVTQQERSRRAAAGRGTTADRPRHVPPAQPPPVPAPHGWVKKAAPWVPQEVAAALKGAPSALETPWQRPQDGKRPKFSYRSDGSDVAIMNDFVLPGPSANTSAILSARRAFVAGNLDHVRRAFGSFGSRNYQLRQAPPWLLQMHGHLAGRGQHVQVLVTDFYNNGAGASSAVASTRPRVAGLQWMSRTRR